MCISKFQSFRFRHYYLKGLKRSSQLAQIEKMEVDDEDRFVYVDDIPQLLEIASSKIALVMWYSYISRSKLDANQKQVKKIYLEFGNNSTYVHGMTDDYEKHCDEMVECLNVPKVIRKLVRNAIDCIVHEMNLYIEDLFHIIGEYVFDPDWCVWLSNGKIDYRQSAMKILESTTSQLNNVQKFAIMCEFCFEDQIAGFPMNSLPKRFCEWRVNYSCLLEYWYYHTKMELHKMETYGSIFYAANRWRCGTRGPRDQQPILSTIEDFNRFRINYRASGPPLLLNTRMALSRFNKCWTTFEYFWTRLDSDEQINLAKIIFEFESCDNSSRRLERLLGLMSRYQQRSLLSLIHMKIIRSFIKTDSSKPAYWAWTQSKDLVTNHIDTFVETVTYLFKCKLDVEEWMSWLVNIWDSAAESYKISAAERITDELLSHFTFNNRPSRSALKFLCRILMRQSLNWRRNEALKQTDLLVFGIADHHHSSNGLLKLFLPSADVRSKIEKLILKCDSMSKAITDKHFIYDANRWNVLSKFIDELFPGNRSSASETKKHFIISRLSDFSHCEDDYVYDVTQLMRIVDTEFKENEVNDLKRTLFLSFISKFSTNDKYRWYKVFFDEKYFHHFVKWCIGNGDRAVLEYEDGAFFDAIFKDVFDVLNEEYIKEDKFDESLLSNLNQFLVWHLVSDEEVKSYKLSQITSPRDLKIFYSIGRNDDSSKLILTKFFENDELAINKFKSKKRKSTS